MKSRRRPSGDAPPRWVRCLAWFLPADRREDLLGDVTEALTDAKRSGAVSALAVASWILGTALRLRWLAALRRTREAASQLGAAPLELRAAFRQFRSSPLYSGAVLSTVGLGTCVAIVAGSLATGTLRPDFPYADAGRLVAVFATERDGAEFRNPVSPADFLDWQAQIPLRDLTAARPWSPSLTVDGRSSRLTGLLATPNLFELLGSAAASGSPFAADVLETVESPVVLASRLAARLGLGRADIGRVLRLDGEPHVIAAIMPPDFLFPPFWMEDAEIWAPLDLRGESGPDARGARFLRVFGRLPPDATIATVQAELDAWAAMAQREYPSTNTGVGARVEHLATPAVERSRLPLLALLGAAIALLLLIEFNLALLLRARTAMRARELAVRAALGASAARVRMILLCETGLLVAVGTLVGGMAAPSVLRLVQPLAAELLPRFSSMRVDATVVAALVAVQAVSVVLVSGRGVMASPDGSRLRSRGLSTSLGSRRMFVVAEVAITAWLLLTATLLLSSFERLAGEDLGFEPSRALSVRLDVSRAVDEDRRRIVLAELEDWLAATPGVGAAGLVNHLPIRGDLWRTRVFGVGSTPAEVDIRAAYRISSAGGRRALGLKLLSGRWIEEIDGDGGEPALVINQRAADVLWPGEAPDSVLDREVALGSLGEGGSRHRVIGVVANVKQTGVGDVVIPEVYLPLGQTAPALLGDLTLIVRGEQTARLEDAVRRAVQPLGPDAVLFQAEPLEQVVSSDLLNERVQAGVASGFALFSVLVAGFGVFALIGTVGSVRRHEFAIRRVLGSTGRTVLLLVLREGAWLGLLGAGAGLTAAFLLGRALEPLLFELDPLAPGRYAMVAAGTVGLALLVSLPSAWRAARTPIVQGIER